VASIGSIRAAVAIIISMLPLTTAAGPANRSEDGTSNEARCAAKGSVTRLEVRCPTASLTELLGALRSATGLRSEHGPQLGGSPVSVTLIGGSLLQVLETALSAFNFVFWIDDGALGVPRLSISARDVVDPAKQTSGSADHATDFVQRSQASQQTGAPPTPVEFPTAISLDSPGARAESADVATTGAPSAIPADAPEPFPATGVLLLPPTAGATPLEPDDADAAAGIMQRTNAQP
jgi:hypothetical protein